MFACNFCQGACESFKIRSFSCCGRAKRDSPRPPTALYATVLGPQQFVLFNTPFVEVKEWMVWDALPFHTVTLFYRDTGGRIRAVLHHEPHDIMHRISHVEPPVSVPECDSHQGVLVEDLLPDHLRAPILSFMNDTLSGTWYQLHAFFNVSAKIIRTFPITNHRDRVVAGVMLIGPLDSGGGLLPPAPQNMMDRTNTVIDSKAELDVLETLPSTRHLGRRVRRHVAATTPTSPRPPD